MTDTEGNISDVSNLATKNALITVENKITSVSSLVKKKTDYNTKITEIENKLNNHNHDKYITTPEFNSLAANVFNARLSRASSVTKKVLMLNCPVLTEKLQKIKQNIYLFKMSWISYFNKSIYFFGKCHFEKDGVQNYLVLQPVIRYFKIITNTKYDNGNLKAI